MHLFLSKNMGVPLLPTKFRRLWITYTKKSAEGGKLIFTYLHEPCLDISWSTERSQKVPWPMSREWVVKLNGEKPGKKRLDLTYTVSFHTQITIQYCGLFSVGPSHLISQNQQSCLKTLEVYPKCSTVYTFRLNQKTNTFKISFSWDILDNFNMQQNAKLETNGVELRIKYKIRPPLFYIY